jgi:hypothetical protein
MQKTWVEMLGNTIDLVSRLQMDIQCNKDLALNKINLPVHHHIISLVKIHF